MDVVSVSVGETRCVQARSHATPVDFQKAGFDIPVPTSVPQVPLSCAVVPPFAILIPRISTDALCGGEGAEQDGAAVFQDRRVVSGCLGFRISRV